MTLFSTGRTAAHRSRCSFFAGLAAALVLLLLALGVHAAPAKGGLSSEDKACLECHARPDREKSLPNGDKLSLKVSPEAFAQSVHASSGCEACHADVDLDSHVKQPKKIASRRALAVEMMEQCRDCHKKTVKLYEDGVHSALVKMGSDRAPLCSDCHNPHTTRPLKAQAEAAPEPVACQNCHERVSRAFAQSVHGAAGEELACKDCHRTHDVKAAAFADNMRTQCLSCHKDVATTHAEWLPNTERHLEAISCPACHSPETTRRVNLRLYEGNTPHQSTGKVGVPTFVKLGTAADASGAGLDARALWSLLQEFNQNGSPGASGKLVLRGRLEVQTAEQAHQLGAKALAVKDCNTCHRRGAASFQAVTISMAGADGRPLRHEASKGLLTSIGSIGSVGGFYAIGSNRIVLLDILLLMALGAGIMVPSAHLTLKWFFRRRGARQARLAALEGRPNETDRTRS